MKALSKLCHVLGIAWSGLLVLSIVLSVIGMFISEPTLYHGWKRVTETFSPFNYWNTILIFILSLPAFGLFRLQHYFLRKSLQRQ